MKELKIASKIIEKIKGDIDINYVIEFGACNECGDSLQTIKSYIPTHNDRYKKIYIAWCMDCMDIKGFIIFRE